LSFIPDWRKALGELARSLKPGGLLLLEVEGKWNIDLFWELVSAVGADFLGYGQPLSTALKHVAPPWNVGHMIDYPFALSSGSKVTMKLKLFTVGEIESEMKKVGLVVEKRWGLHVLTNVVPSTILHKANPSIGIKKLFTILAKGEGKVNKYWPFNAFGCSILMLARRKENQHESE